MLEEVRDNRITELPEELRDNIHPTINKRQKRQNDKYMMMMQEKAKSNPEALKKLLEQEKIPEHPSLQNIDGKNLRELAHIAENFLNRTWKKQWNQQLAQLVEIEITINKNAREGNRELRIRTPRGMSNPMMFQVDNLPEKTELEPNNISANQKLPQLQQLPVDFLDQTVDLPVILNGQIMPGDIDRFRFKADKKQKLVIDVRARQLVPYLADAVPGWFQAVITLYDSKGKKLVFDDDFRFNPDPVLYYTIPETGDYEIEIRDAVYRGRRDFVYRIKISEEPFVTHVFPLGGECGTRVLSRISGYNLPATNIFLNTKFCNELIHETYFYKKNYKSNPIIYAVNNLPECFEKESNDLTNQAQTIEVPKIINGQIHRKGDIDLFKINGKAGEEIVAEVYARKLNSPLNSLLRIIDDKGKILKWNDDYIVKDKFLHESTTGLMTHHADSYLKVTLPETGIYYIQISDTLKHGGKAYAYRLRISNPQPDFTLFSAPSTLNALAGGTVPITVYAIRKEGFTGPIKIISKNKHLKISGGVIPENCDKISMTLTAIPEEYDYIYWVKLIGKAKIEDKEIVRRVIPADNTMQAFLYRHLVGAKELLLFSKKINRRAKPAVRMIGSTPVKIKNGSETEIFFKSAVGRRIFEKLKIELDNPPEGITITNINLTANGFAIKLHADNKILKPNYKDNLIFAVYHYIPKPKNKKRKTNRNNFRVTTLPAVPIEIERGDNE